MRASLIAATLASIGCGAHVAPDVSGDAALEIATADSHVDEPGLIDGGSASDGAQSEAAFVGVFGVIEQPYADTAQGENWLIGGINRNSTEQPIAGCVVRAARGTVFESSGTISVSFDGQSFNVAPSVEGAYLNVINFAPISSGSPVRIAAPGADGGMMFRADVVAPERTSLLSPSAGFTTQPRTQFGALSAVRWQPRNTDDVIRIVFLWGTLTESTNVVCYAPVRTGSFQIPPAVQALVPEGDVTVRIASARVVRVRTQPDPFTIEARVERTLAVVSFR